MRPLLVGEQPGGTVGPVLGGRAATVLCSLAGIAPGDDAYEALRACYGLANLLPDPGRWDPRLARERARIMVGEMPPISVLLGVRVARAFGLPGLWARGYLDNTSEHWAFAIPHPSGRNRIYNDGRSRDRARGILRAAAALTAEAA